MTVFNGYLKMFKRNLGIAAIYFGIFLGIVLMMEAAMSKEGGQSFSAKELDVAVVDLDKSQLSEQLISYLKKIHNISIEKDDKAKLAEELYYGGRSVALRIEEGFEEKALAGEDGIKLTNRPGSYSGIYLEQQINRFVGNAITYHSAGYSINESCEKVSAQKESKVSIEDINGNGGETPGYASFFQFVPYLFICVFGEVLGKIFFLFRERAVKNRALASSVSLLRQNAETILAFFIIGSIVYALCVVISLILYGEGILESTNFGWYLVNSFINMVSGLEIAYLIGLLVKKELHVNTVTVSVSLALSFLGGVFVPLNVMGEQIKNISKFLPTYWYETVNNLLIDHADICGSIQTQVLTGMGVQVLFLLALAGIGMAIAKYQQQER